MRIPSFAVFCAIVLVALPVLGADFNVGNAGSTSYVINGTNDPELTLYRGATYTFQIATPGHPFWIKLEQVTGTGAAYNAGVTNNGISNGTLTFAVPSNAPSQLFYICEFHSAMTNRIIVADPTPVDVSTWTGVKELFRP